jgi:thiamine biosynthesis protein ThiS
MAKAPKGAKEKFLHRMKLHINGDERTFDSPLTLAALIEVLDMKPDRVAVELNRDIVPRDRWAETRLNDGDRLEVVHFVGGGIGLSSDQELS